MVTTVKCESQFIYDVRSFHVKADGTRENSWGLSQINLPHWPEISREQAIDPIFAIDFMAYQFSKGKQHYWTCWRMHYGGESP